MKTYSRVFNTHYHFDASLYPGKFPGFDGVTVPGQALSISEIQARYVRGLPLPIDQRLGYTDLDTTDFDHLDKLGKIDATRAIARRRESIEADLNKIHADAKKAKQKEDFEASVNQRITELKQQPDDTKGS